MGAGRKQGVQGGGSGVILRELTCLSQACAGQGAAKPPIHRGDPRALEQLTGLLHSHITSHPVPPPRSCILQQQPGKSGLTGAVNLSLQRPSSRACVVLFPNRL